LIFDLAAEYPGFTGDKIRAACEFPFHEAVRYFSLKKAVAT